MKLFFVVAALMTATAVTAQAQTISAERAREIALARVSNHQGIISEELESENGVLIYEFDIETAGPGHREVRVDAQSGTVVGDRHEDDVVGGSAAKIERGARKLFGKEKVSAADAAISQSTATRIALRRVPNGSIREMSLKKDDGILVWEVEVQNAGNGRTELTIDAQTGTILKQKNKD